MRGGTDVSPSSSSFIAFKPRQVLLLQQRNRSASTPMAQLKSDDDSILVFSVALWLQTKGFSKVLKRFCAAAHIEDEDWKAKALNLNEIFSKYTEISNSVSKDLKSLEKKEEQVTVAAKTANGTTDEEIKSKKKKKKSKDSSAVNGSEKTLEDTTMTDKINESHEDDSREASKKSNGVKISEVEEEQPTKKPKEKKKKSKLATEDGTDESKKDTKKRKRMDPDENDNKSGQEVAIEESKSKKSKVVEESKAAPPHTDHPKANGDSSEEAEMDALQGGESTKNDTNNDEIEESYKKKSASKQPKSSEPTTLKAFQRVKIDEVEFVDDRLQDNSYWAKHGAETGYGAKAQEVLGQVKGRGFRHEKTKKKRGSYRGGQIDLQSHSIKFKDSDEE